MKILYTETTRRFEAHDSFAHRDALKAAGWRFDTAGRFWHTTSPAQAEPFRASFDPSAAAEADKAAPKSSPLITAGFSSPAIAAARRLASQPDSVFIGPAADRIEACRALADLKSGPILIISSETEYSRWSPQFAGNPPENRTINIIKPETRSIRLNESDIAITTHNRFTRYDSIAQWNFIPWSAIIIDEIADLDEKKAFTHHILDKLVTSTHNLIFTANETVFDKPITIWPVLRRFIKMSRQDFAERFCAGFRMASGLRAPGASNIPELKEKLGQTLVIA